MTKFHKANISGRPLVSSAECHTRKISKCVDNFLQPHAKSLLSYIKDTSGFKNRINETKDVQKDTILVNLDVKSLYTNDSNHEGIEAVKALKSVKFRVSKAGCYESCQILVLNTLHGTHYLQKVGCVMGTICAHT